MPLARLSVPESALIRMLAKFVRFHYTWGKAYYPVSLPGVTQAVAPLAPPEETNCCCFCEGLLVATWHEQHGSRFSWDLERHNQIMPTLEVDDPSSAPVKAVVSAGMATALPKGARPNAWCLAQGWSSYPKGHQFIVVARHANDRVLTLEANGSPSLKLDGVGCRMFGNLRDLPGLRPPPRWWENPAAPTWKSLASGYPGGLHLAQLAVTGATWAGLP